MKRPTINTDKRDAVSNKEAVEKPNKCFGKTNGGYCG